MKRFVLVALVAALALTSVTRDVRAATDCKDKFTLLTRDWFASKIDCGVDAAIGGGQGAVKQLGINLAKTVLSDFSPQLAELLFGASDPFAAQAKRILSAIDLATERIIDSQLLLFEDNTRNVATFVMRDWFQRMATETFEQKLAGHQAGEYTHLTDRLVDTRAKLQELDYVFGVRSLHSLVLVVSWTLALEPESALLKTTIGHQIASGHPPDDFTDEEWAQVEADAASAAAQKTHITLADRSGGFLTYVAALSEQDEIRNASDSRFEIVARFTFPAPLASRQFRYNVSRVPANDDAGEPPVLFHILVVDRSYRCASDGECFQAGNEVDVRHFGPNDDLAEFSLVLNGDGIEYVDDTIITPLFDEHRDDAYDELLVVSYGTVRETIDRFHRLIGQEPPTLQIDEDLAAALLRMPSVGEQVSTLLFFTQERRALTTLERRMVDNYIVAYGAFAVGELRWWSLVDPFLIPRGPPVEDYLRFMRRFDEPSEAQAFFRGIFGAKLVAVML